MTTMLDKLQQYGAYVPRTSASKGKLLARLVAYQANGMPAGSRLLGDCKVERFDNTDPKNRKVTCKLGDSIAIGNVPIEIKFNQISDGVEIRHEPPRIAYAKIEVFDENSSQWEHKLHNGFYVGNRNPGARTQPYLVEISREFTVEPSPPF